jgi:hypothetical protein
MAARSLVSNSRLLQSSRVPSWTQSEESSQRKLAPAALLFGAAVAMLSTTAKCDESSADNVKMYYRMLGNTGLKVSVLSYGFWATFGVKSDLTKQDGVEMGKLKRVNCVLFCMKFT